MLCGGVFGLQCLVFVLVHAVTNAFKPKDQAASSAKSRLTEAAISGVLGSSRS